MFVIATKLALTALVAMLASSLVADSAPNHSTARRAAIFIGAGCIGIVLVAAIIALWSFPPILQAAQ